MEGGERTGRNGGRDPSGGGRIGRDRGAVCRPNLLCGTGFRTANAAEKAERCARQPRSPLRALGGTERSSNGDRALKFHAPTTPPNFPADLLGSGSLLVLVRGLEAV